MAALPSVACTIRFCGAPSWALTAGAIPQINNVFGVGYNDLDDLNTTVENLLKTFLSPSNYALLNDSHSKGSLIPKNHLKWNLTVIGDSILNEIKMFTTKLGISNVSNANNALKSVKMNRLSSVDSIYYELFSFPYEIIPIVMKTISDFRTQVKSNNYVARGYSPLKLKLSDNAIFPRSLKTICSINKSKNYVVKFTECLNTKPSTFDIPKAAINIAKYSPEIVGSIVRSRLKKSIPRHPTIKGQRYNEYEAMICQVLTSTSRIFENCLKELRRIDDCVSEKMKKTEKRNYHLSPSSVRFVKNFKNFSDSCKLDRKILTISCYDSSHSKEQFDVISLMKNFTGTSFATGAMQSIGKQFVSLMFKSSFGENFLDELGTLAYVYHQGSMRQNKLEKMSRHNINVKQKYEKFSKSLESYERNLISVAISTINDVQTIATSVERTLVHSMSKFLGMDLREHLRSMKCLHKLIDVILSQLLGNDNGSDDSPGESEDGNQESEGEVSDSTNEDQVESDGGSLETNGDYWDSLDDEKSEEEATDNAINLYRKSTKNFLNSMKRLIKTKIQRNSNTIAMLANTFLLATMFYECIAILAAAIYRPGSIENTSLPMIIHEDTDEQNDNETWDGRFTRSLVIPNKRGIDDSVNSSKYINHHNAYQD